MNTSDVNTEAPQSAVPPPAPESEEKIRKVYVKDLRDKEPIHTVFRVTKKVRHTARSGKVFLSLSLGDRTGEVDGRIFENIDAAEGTFAEGDYVLIKGNVITYQGRQQIVVEQLERLDPEPIDAKEFEVPPAPAQPAEPQAAPRGEGGKVVGQIRELAQRVQDPNVRALLLAFLDDPEIGEPLARAPAAKGIHHAYRGGLADHILSVMRLAHRIADHYPMADRDLLIAGALLHDIMKVKEIVAERGGYEYTDEGRLVGHLVMTAQAIREKAARLEGFPALLEHHITHIVLAHHGRMDWGSPKVPMTLEALLVHEIDTIDSRVASWLELMARDPNERWTENTRLYDRHLWKGVVPTVRGKAPVETRGGGKRHKEKQRQQQGQEQREPKEHREPREAREPRAEGGKPPQAEGRPPREERREGRPPRERRDKQPAGGGGGSRELTFKPFAVLTQTAPAAEPAPQDETKGGAAATPSPEGEPTT